MLTLNHANLPVADVPSLRDFFVRHFGFTPLGESGNDAFAVLRSAGGFILNVMKQSENDAGAFPKNFHVGFMLRTVEAMTRRGVSSVTFYCTAPNEILVEVSCYEV